MRSFGLILIAIAFFWTDLSAQTSPPKRTPPEASSWGSVSDGKFVSDRIRMSLQIPANLIVFSAVDSEILTNAGAELLKNGTVQETKIDEAIGNAIRLVAVAEKPFGSPENSALELVAAKQQAGVTANMTLASNMMLLKGTPFSLKRSLGSIKIGPNTFAAAEIEGSFGNLKFMSRMYVVMHRGYSIVCQATYYTETQRLEMEKVLATLSLYR